MKSLPTRARLAFAAAAVALALGACSVTRPAPVKGTFLLEPAMPAPVAKAQATSLRVGTVTVATPYRGRNFVSREGELRFETDYYNEFLVPPATMIGELTARALERAKVFALVVPPSSTADTDWLLDAFVPSLYVDARDPAKMVADIEVTYYLFRADAGGGLPLWTQTYRQRVPLGGTTAQAYAAALNTALAQILADLARDLSAANLQKRG